MSLFPSADEATIVLEMRTDRLVATAQSYFPQLTLSDSYIYNAVLAAESELEHDLRVFFEPVVCVPEGTPQSDINALIAAKTRYVNEPAYDWDPSFFLGNKWGMIQVRHRPVISVASMTFDYPSTSTNLFTFPIDWVRIDSKPGILNIVPLGTGEMPLNAWVMQVYGGGRSVPHMIQINYTAGLSNAAGDYPELIDLIKKMATLRIIDDMFLPQSDSTSADGLSGSQSIDTQKHHDIIKKRITKLRQQIHGIQVGFA